MGDQVSVKPVVGKFPGDATAPETESGPTLAEQIHQLKDLQAEMKKARKEAQKKLKNLERKKKRLSVKAKLLTDEDLVQVLKLRQAKAAKSATPSGSSSSHEPPRPEV